MSKYTLAEIIDRCREVIAEDTSVEDNYANVMFLEGRKSLAEDILEKIEEETSKYLKKEGE